MTGPEALPFVDEHRVSIRAGADAVWAQLGRTLARSPSAAALLGLLLGTEPARAHGDPLATGSTLPGFAVRRAEPGRELLLVGRHRFARYALGFTLDARPGSTELTARTHAEFPGVLGRAYRAAVIGSGGHVVVTRRLLHAVRVGAEAG